MSDNQTTPETTVSVTAPSQEPQTVDDLPGWAREKLTKANNEAARYRTEKRDAVEEAKEAIKAEYEGKIAEKETAFTELEGKLGDAGIKLTKLRIALAMSVPSDRVLAFADLLKGSSEDEIKASAESAYELFGGFKTPPVGATDPTQGRGGDALPLNGDKLLDALKRVVGAP